MFSFQQRPCWKECLDNTTKKRAARKWYFEKELQKYGLIILCFKTLENVAKRVDKKLVEENEKRVKWWNELKYNWYWIV